MDENILRMAVKNFFTKEIDLAKRQSTKEFIQTLDKIVDKNVDDFIRIILQAVREEDK